MSESKRRLRVRLALLLVVSAALVPGIIAVLPSANSVGAASTPIGTTVSLSGGVIASWYPGSGPNAATALVELHGTDSTITASQCVDMVELGFSAICGKAQYLDEATENWDQLALNIGSEVAYAKAQPGITKVVLVGQSGGGEIMAYYENVADHGLSACQAPGVLDPCESQLAHLTPADGVVLFDTSEGEAFLQMARLDPAVPSVTPSYGLSPEQGLTPISADNPSMYLFNTANGYNTNQQQSGDYSQSVINSFTEAQGQREAALVSQAQSLQSQIAAGNGDFSDDMPFPIGHDASQMAVQDTSLLDRTVNPELLITPSCPNGCMQSPYVSTTFVPSLDTLSSASANNSYSGKVDYTVNSFLSTDSISAPDFQETDDSISGVNWASSNTSTVTNVAGITQPLLIMGMTASTFVTESEMYYDAATESSHATLAFVYGAEHGFTPCPTATCGIPQSAIGNTVSESFNYAANWLASYVNALPSPTMPVISNIPASGVYGSSFSGLTVSTNGDGATSISSSTPSVCTISGTTVSYVGVGTCTLTASVATGTDYAAATGNPQSFPVNQATPSTPVISNIPATNSFGASFVASVSTNGDGTRSVTSSTPNVCTVGSDGLTVTYVDAGTCTLTANVGTGTDYLAASGAPQSFNVGAPLFVTLGGSGTGVSVTGNGNVTVSGQSVIDSNASGAITLTGSSAFRSSGGVASPGSCIASGSSQCPVVTPGSSSDPYALLVSPSTSGLPVYSGSSNQGCGVYTQTLDIVGNTATTLNPANLSDCVYYLEAGFTAGASATVSTASNGALLYIAGGGVSCSGNAQCNLDAIADPSSIYHGIAIFQARSDPSNVSSTVNVLNTNGAVIYAPDAVLAASGNGRIDAGGVVCQELTDSGSAAVGIS